MRIPVHRAVVLAGASALVGLGLGLSVPAVASGPSAPPGSRAESEAAFPHMDHVFVIMMENTGYNSLLTPSNTNTTYIQYLAQTYGLATHYYGVTHTSLPNYVAATSGSTWGSHSDDEAQANDGYFNHFSLFDELSQAHVSWAGYMESMPSAGFTGTKSSTGLYVRKHNPFMQYPDIFDNPRLADNVMPLTTLTTALRSGHVAQFVWITPNVCNDMHGGAATCPYATSPTSPNQAKLYQDGDAFLHTWITAITHSKSWTGNSAIFVTWDEGSYADTAPYGPLDDSGCCDSPVLAKQPVTPVTATGGDLAGGNVYGGGHVPMIVIARNGARHATDSAPANHYSLLQTIELNWNLPLLGNAGDKVQVQSLAPLLLPGHARSDQ